MIFKNLTIPLHLILQLISPEFYENGESTLDKDVPLPNRNVVLPEGYHAFPDIGVAYKYYEDARQTWNTARTTCIEHNSTLAVIDSRKKIGYVQSIRGNVYWSVFVGIHRSFHDSEWVDAKNGVPVSAIPWAPNTDKDKVQYNCLSLWYDGRGACGEPCENERDFVCEIPLK